MFRAHPLKINYLQRCEVDDTVNLWVRFEDLLQLLLVGQVALVELGSFAANQLDAIQRDLGGIVEAVDDNDLVAMLEKGQRSK